MSMACSSPNAPSGRGVSSVSRKSMRPMLLSLLLQTPIDASLAKNVEKPRRLLELIVDQSLSQNSVMSGAKNGKSVQITPSEVLAAVVTLVVLAENVWCSGPNSRA